MISLSDFYQSSWKIQAFIFLDNVIARSSYVINSIITHKIEECHRGAVGDFFPWLKAGDATEERNCPHYLLHFQPLNEIVWRYASWWKPRKPPWPMRERSRASHVQGISQYLDSIKPWSHSWLINFDPLIFLTYLYILLKKKIPSPFLFHHFYPLIALI